jgi:hypothetical protein
MTISDILWTFTHRNRPSGEAFVTFNSNGDTAKALALDKQMIGKRYVEVFPSTQAQVDAARESRRVEKLEKNGIVIDSTQQQQRHQQQNHQQQQQQHHVDNDPNETTVMMYGMPFAATQHNVEEFFAGYSFIAGSVRLDTDATGKGTGTGCISFTTNYEAIRAMHERNRKYIGKRFVNLHFPNRRGMPLPPLPTVK